jgi:hypothetical protein
MNRLLLVRLARLFYAPAGHGRLYRLAHHPPTLPAIRIPFRPVLELLGLLFTCGLMLTPAIILWLAIAVLVIILNGTLFGAWWANQMAALLTNLRSRGVYDQYAVFPGGRLNLHVAISSGILHRLESLPNLHRLIRGTAIVLGGFTALSLCMIGINASGWRATDSLNPAIQTSLNTSLGLLTFLLLFYIDHFASITLSALCGMLVPVWTGRTAEARLWAVGLFLSLQVISYAIWGILALGVLPQLPIMLGGLGRLLLIVAQVGLYLLIREGTIRLVWNRIVTELELSPGEIKALL